MFSIGMGFSIWLSHPKDKISVDVSLYMAIYARIFDIYPAGHFLVPL